MMDGSTMRTKKKIRDDSDDEEGEDEEELDLDDDRLFTCARR